ncbi:phytosulfokine receptor 1-like [Dorcoceras hygrometricum]|uniref:Phytosulfokine receptor 1-like n=1 Tax=Dorcoceras hygrometricum TaxID=472368 RepID=A0A2Z7A4N3_9LAMI|nr:phytosulfokine receptor 1-like [Dorcoceras hygrometricum]
MGTGIDQLNLHSVQLGYLKVLQVGNADPNNTKAGKQIRDQASLDQRINWQIKSLEPLYHAQQVSRWKSSVRDLQGLSTHHSSVVFRQNNQSVTTPMIALDFSGTTNQSASHNVALKQLPTLSHTPHAAADRRRSPTAAARRPPPPSPGFSRDRTCFDHRDEENPFVLKSVRSSSAD